MSLSIIKSRITDAKQCTPNIFSISNNTYESIIRSECKLTSTFSYESWKNFIRQSSHEQIKQRCEKLRKNVNILTISFRNKYLGVKYKRIWFEVACRPPSSSDIGGCLYKLCEARFKSNIAYINVK